ncbi:MAG: CsbD family protein [Geminicoccaceae bacterium]|nr:MAG: CsbD family protein [Geminicoccaceae bacterium]
MDKDRIKGSAKQIWGRIKQAAGKLTGDTKLETDGRTEKAVGKVQNAYGGAKDKLRDARAVAIGPRRCASARA